MDYTNWKKEKDKVSDNEYFNVADWCNESGQYTIEERGKYFQVVKIPEPTAEEQQKTIKDICSEYINNISWRVERYNTQKALEIETSDSEETYFSILRYMQYLRDYDKQSGEWWTEAPKTFEEWGK